MATIERRGKLQYRAKVRRGKHVQSKTFESRKAAEEWAVETERAIRDDTMSGRQEAESTTLKEALGRYEREVTPHKKSAADEPYKLRNWKESSLADRELAFIHGKHVAEWRDEEIDRGSAPATVRRKLALLSHVFEIARKEWGMTTLTNPVASIRVPSAGPGRERRLVPGEESKLLAAAVEYESSRSDAGHIAFIIAFSLETAMRRGEIARMKWEHVDRKACVLLVPETKTDPRRVPLSSRALEILSELPRRIRGDVWGMRPDSITHAFDRVCDRAGIKGLRFHDLRHEAISRLFEKGLNLMEVAAISGHKTLQMLKRYTHLRAEDLAKRLG
ncbi:MAG: site-specific integrase [Pseudomonadota bacterium]|nr:site-specific integrase [Pseudomonadota bacterium]